MELRQLEYFMAVCEELHFSRASEKLCTTQSNLSQQIKSLENELGVPLFDRMGKRIALTDAGQILLEQSRYVFSHISYARDAIAEMKTLDGGSLSIGVLPGDGDLLFNTLLVEFHRQYPNISLSLTETTSIQEQVIAGTIDIGVTITPLPDERITQIPLFQEEFSLAVHSGHPLAKEPSIPFRQLQHHKMVMFGQDHQVRQLIQYYLMIEGFKLQPPIETNTLSALLTLVEQGIGSCILPRLLLENLDNPSIIVIPLTDPTPSQEICILYRTDRYMGFAARTFIATLQAYIQTAMEHAMSR